MKMFRHDNVTGDRELVLYPNFFKNLEEKIFATRRLQELTTVVTTAGDEMEFTATVESL